MQQLIKLCQQSVLGQLKCFLFAQNEPLGVRIFVELLTLHIYPTFCFQEHLPSFLIAHQESQVKAVQKSHCQVLQFRTNLPKVNLQIDCTVQFCFQN